MPFPYVLKKKEQKEKTTKILYTSDIPGKLGIGREI